MKIVCILAGGIGNRFRSAVPKQYHLLNARPVIEYVIEASVKSSADEVMIVANKDYRYNLESKYGVLTIEGGKKRNHSIFNAITYIRDTMQCEKLIIIDAVCPLINAEILNLYFDYLDEYDAVFTTSDITTSIGKYDGSIVNCSDFFLIQSPDAYRFDMLSSCFNASSDTTTPLYQLRENAKVKFYYEFKDYIKIVYPHDIAIAGALLNERERYIRFVSHADTNILGLFAKLRQMNRKSTKVWERKLDVDMEKLFSAWEIYEFTINRDAYMGLVLECGSRKYGAVIIKIYAPFLEKRYKKELYILKNLQNYHQCTLLDYDYDKCAMLLERIIPGDYIEFSEDTKIIEEMFKDMEENKVAISTIEDIEPEIKGILQQAEEEFQTASKCDYQIDKVRYLLENAKAVYDEYFITEDKSLLHGDAYFKNALRGKTGVRLIDPVGYQDAFIFEYMPFFTYELIINTDTSMYREKFKKLVAFFEKFTNISKFYAAVYIFLVKQLIPSIYEANDHYKRADKYLGLIKDLYLDENDNFVLKKFDI